MARRVWRGPRRALGNHRGVGRASGRQEQIDEPRRGIEREPIDLERGPVLSFSPRQVPLVFGNRTSSETEFGL